MVDYIILGLIFGGIICFLVGAILARKGRVKLIGERTLMPLLKILIWWAVGGVLVVAGVRLLYLTGGRL